MNYSSSFFKISVNASVLILSPQNLWAMPHPRSQRKVFLGSPKMICLWNTRSTIKITKVSLILNFRNMLPTSMY